MASALIVVDVQNDFCDEGVPSAGGSGAGGGGSLAVAGGTEVARRITALLRSGHRYGHVVATRDWHIDPGAHFAEHPDFVSTWPTHCVAGTVGAQLHPDLDTSSVEAVFDKGAHAAAYSGFEGRCADVGLSDWLRQRSVDTVEVVGIATDHCVRATALDAVRAGFGTTVRLDLTAGVAASTVETALAELAAAGVRLVGEPLVRS